MGSLHTAQIAEHCSNMTLSLFLLQLILTSFTNGVQSVNCPNSQPTPGGPFSVSGSCGYDELCCCERTNNCYNSTIASCLGNTWAVAQSYISCDPCRDSLPQLKEAVWSKWSKWSKCRKRQKIRVRYCKGIDCPSKREYQKKF